MKLTYLICVLAIVFVAAGCRNRCGNGCLNPWAPATIPSPPTYSLQLPGSSSIGSASATASGQSGASIAASNTIQTGNLNPPSPNLPTGWNGSVVGNPPYVPGSLGSTTMGTSNYQASASSVYGTGGGTSRIVNHDYTSTPYNDRLDPSRLALSDASQVRPPVNFQTNLSPNDPRLANSNVPGVYQPSFGMNQPRPGFSGQTVVQGQFAAPQSQFPPANPATDPNRQAGWQNRNGVNR